ncbi:3-oxosteroid 1-dehydrogenase [Actinocorallia herbida]|uniref:3-oxosteroid 1-dehydrogenase n=1 Tax=Actinocorallia herbida TaxID=58109 RepID=A0A3N1D1X0_9ACTN|nr:FAD-binding protein [Actinocorallia herbida]ROO87534.1 3-oxosteroid 1-dehydrogenase [Actinocorallia herbida]
MPAWDHHTDFLVVGSGGGLAGAVTASAAGLDVLVVEKSAFLGGSLGISGGVLWLPDNPVMKRHGLEDSLENALDHFASVVGDAEKIGPASSLARRRAYVTAGADMVRLLEKEGVEFALCDGNSDYYAEIPGVEGAVVNGRAIEATLYDTGRLGPLGRRLRPAIAAPLVVRTAEAGALTLIRVSLRSLGKAVRIGARTAFAALRRKRMTSNGGALTAQLLDVLLRREVPIWTEASLEELVVEDGRVVGAVVKREERTVRVGTRAGVLIASGGFARNAGMRTRHGGGQPADGTYTLANPEDTGGPIGLAVELGAATDLMDEAWWVPVFHKLDGTLGMVLPERFRPGSIIVDGHGERYFNEAESAMEAGRQMYRRQAETGAGVPSWLILDARHRARYLLGMMPPGITPKSWIERGLIKRADTIAGLAAKCGIPPETLKDTVERFNAFAADGVDQDFHRGRGAHERSQGDPTHGPNPCLGPVGKAPFYAVEIFPGDVGTSGGLLCDEHSRVLDGESLPIPGLYATGNATASVMGRAYPAGGASIGATCVFAHVAGEHAASVSG